MPLTLEQLGRIAERFPTLVVDGTCTIVNSHFEPRVKLGAGTSVRWSRLGADVEVGEGCRIGGASIGEGSVIGAGCVIGADEGEEAPPSETRIGRGVRIGEGAQISPGVSIADGAVVAPHSRMEVNVAGVCTSWGGDGSSPEDRLPLGEFLLEKLPLFHVHRRWLAARGDETLRVEYPLAAGDVVLDVGGYLGDWAEQMVRRYRPRLHVFEPVGSFVRAIRERLGGRVVLHEFGLAGRTREESITLAAEGSSVIKGEPSAAHETIRLVAAAEVFGEVFANVGEIALMKINIEGCEYELLEHLVAEGLMPRIRYLQVQFHDFVPDARNWRRALREALARTHRATYNYPFIWEGWTRHPQ